MKYLGHKMSLDTSSLTTSASLQSWFGHELEVRGIDAVIYTRYILSILQQDNFDVECMESEFFPPSKKETAIKGRGRGRKGEKRRSGEFTADEMKKSAAIECLLSVSDGDSGIQNLVEELYTKLKDQEKGKGNKPTGEKSTISQSNSDGKDKIDVSINPDPAQRYYAAFPPLSDKQLAAKGTAKKSKTVDDVWAKIAKKSLTTKQKGAASKTSDKESHNDTKSSDPKSNDKKTKDVENKVSKGELDARPTKSGQKRRDGSVGKGKCTVGSKHGYSSYKRYDSLGLRKSSKGGKSKSKMVEYFKSKYTSGMKNNLSRYSEDFGEADKRLLPYGKGKQPQGRNRYQKNMFHDRKPEDFICSTASYLAQLPKISVEELLGKKAAMSPKMLEYPTEPPAQLVPFSEQKRKSTGALENKSWYTEPLDALVPHSPTPSKRLYRRSEDTDTYVDLGFNELFDSDQELTPQGKGDFSFDGNLLFIPDHEESNGTSSRTSWHSSAEVSHSSEAYCQACELIVASEPEGEGKIGTEEDASKDILPDLNEGLQEMCVDGLSYEDLLVVTENNNVTRLKDVAEQNDDMSRLIDIFPPIDPVDTEGKKNPNQIKNLVLVESDETFTAKTMNTSQSMQCSCGQDDPNNETLLSNLKDLVALDQQWNPVLANNQIPISSENDVPDDRPDIQVNQVDTRPDMWYDTQDLAEDFQEQCSLEVNPKTTALTIVVDSPEITNRENNHAYHGTSPVFQKSTERDFFIGDFQSQTDESDWLDSWSNPTCVTSTLLELSISLTSNDFSQMICDSALTGDNGIPSDMHKTSSENSYLYLNSLTNNCYSPSSSLISGKPGIWTYLDPDSSVFSMPTPQDHWNVPWYSYSTPSPSWQWDGLHHDSTDLLASFNSCLSPRYEGSNNTSHLWDVNICKRFDYGFQKERPPDNIQKYLLNLTFEESNSQKKEFQFIEGGVYGPDLWNNQSATEANTCYDSAFDEGVSTDKGEWENFSLHPNTNSFRQRSISADFDSYESYLTGPKRSVEFLPSENSAFRDRIPSRLPQMHHVQSEPTFSRLRALCDCSCRHVEIKHLYKTDSNILKQLGLSSDVGESTPNSEMEVSPNTHFRPIKTPQNSFDSSDISYSVTPRSECEIIILGRMSGYQLYQTSDCPNSEGIIFVPRFKVHQELDKYAQTGEGTDGSPDQKKDNSKGNREDPNSSLNRNMLKRILTDVSEVLDLCEGEEAGLCITGLTDDVFCESDGEIDPADICTSDYESTGLDVSADEFSGNAGIAELWGEMPETVKTESVSTTATITSEVATSLEIRQAYNVEVPKYSTEKPSFKSIWSCGTENDIPSLPGSFGAQFHEAKTSEQELSGTGEAESKVEEEGGLLHYTSNLKWSDGFYVEKGDGDHKDVEQKERERVLEPPDWLGEGEDCFLEDAPNFEMHMYANERNDLPSPGKVLYSSDLEEKWLNSEQFGVQTPKKPYVYRIGGSHKKPCSFFLEGNCRRADCKFAHDISNITCRFWEEGECFKGVTCPFLHGYPSDSPDECDSRSSGNDFTLDNDDFPELGKSQEEEQDGEDVSSISVVEEEDTKSKVQEATASLSNAEGRAKSSPINIVLKNK